MPREAMLHLRSQEILVWTDCLVTSHMTVLKTWSESQGRKVGAYVTVFVFLRMMPYYLFYVT